MDRSTYGAVIVLLLLAGCGATTLPLEVTHYRTVGPTTLEIHYGPCVAEVDTSVFETPTDVQVELTPTYLPEAGGDHPKCGQIAEIELAEPLGGRRVVVAGFPDVERLPDIP